MKLGFAGTPDFATQILSALVDSVHDVEIVFTQPDRPAGRRLELKPSSVRRFAEDNAITVRTPERIRDDVEHIKDIDVLIVAAYGLILPQAVLDAPRRGCINVHASLLPRWRGAAPVERAIMAGDEVTGVSIMQMDAGLDTGPVLLARSTPIRESDSGVALGQRLAALGADALIECLNHLDARDAVVQDETNVTYAAKITAADAVIDWMRPAEAIARQVRALAHRQAAYATLAGERIKVLAALAVPADAVIPGTIVDIGRTLAVGCGKGALVLETVQLSRGKGRVMSVHDAANGYPELFAPGVRLHVAS